MNLTARQKMLEYLLIDLLMHPNYKVCEKSGWVPKTSSCQRVRIPRPRITFPSSFSTYKWKTELLIVSDQPKAAWHCQVFPTTPNHNSLSLSFFVLTDQASALKVKIIFWYVLPVSVTVFLFSVMSYSMYRYIHVGKEKHPANLVSA